MLALLGALPLGREWLTLVGVFGAVIFGAFLNGLRPNLAQARDSPLLALLLAPSYNRWAMEVLLANEAAAYEPDQPNKVLAVLTSVGACSYETTDLTKMTSELIIKTALAVMEWLTTGSSNQKPKTSLITGDRCQRSKVTACIVLVAWGAALRILAAIIDHALSSPSFTRFVGRRFVRRKVVG
jgi:hypothetical protein